MRNLNITSGGTNANTATWYNDVVAFTDPADINKCLQESGIANVRYAKEPVFAQQPITVGGNHTIVNDGSRAGLVQPEYVQLKRDKIVLERLNYRGEWISSTTQDLFFKDRAKREEHNAKNPLNQKPLVRREAHENYLDIVGSDYVMHQPSEVFQVMHGATDKLGLQMHMAGIVNDGQKIFARIDIGRSIKTFDAEIAQYVLALTGIGSSTKGGISQHDHACFNEWYAMIKGSRWGLGNFHHRYALPSETMMKIFVDRAHENITRQQSEIDDLIKSHVTRDQIDEMIKECLLDVRPDDPKLIDSARTDVKAEKKLARVVKLFEHYREDVLTTKDNQNGPFIECESRGTRDNPTAYGAFQSVIWLADRRRSRNRLQSNLDGQIANRKQRAYEMALDFARAA